MALFTITTNTKENLPPSQTGEKIFSISANQNIVLSISNLTIETYPAYSDPEGDELEAIKISSISNLFGSLEYNGIQVTVGQEILASDIDLGLLEYISNANGGGFDDYEFDVSDSGSHLFAGLSGNIKFEVAKATNLPPSSIGDYSHSIDYGNELVLTRDMFTTLTIPMYVDPEGDPESKLKILSLPLSGELKYNGSAVIVNQEINFDDIDLGLLVYQPDLSVTNSNSVTFDFGISDSGSGQFSV